MGAIEAPNMVRPVSLDVLFKIALVLGIEPYMLHKFAPINRKYRLLLLDSPNYSTIETPPFSRISTKEGRIHV